MGEGTQPPHRSGRGARPLVWRPWSTPGNSIDGNSGLEPWIRFLGEDPAEVEMGVSKNRGTPKWMVYNEKPY